MSDDLLTAAEAAALVNRTPATIRSWQHRGTLPVAGTQPAQGHSGGAPANTYRRADVLAAAAVTGGHNARRRPSRATSGDRWDPTARLLTLREAAQTAGVHVRTIRDWIDHGYLPVYDGPGLTFLEAAVLDAERAARRHDPRYRPKG